MRNWIAFSLKFKIYRIFGEGHTHSGSASEGKKKKEGNLCYGQFFNNWVSMVFYLKDIFLKNRLVYLLLGTIKNFLLLNNFKTLKQNSCIRMSQTSIFIWQLH